MPHSEIEPSIRQRARRLRKSRTLGEKAMQDYLRALRPFGAHFRREVPIGPYVVDFAWLSARIVVEVDGASHDLEGRREQDLERDRFLKTQGFKVVRVRDADAIANSGEAFRGIEEVVGPRLRRARSKSTSPPPAASRQPPPHKGEGSRAAAVTHSPSTPSSSSRIK